MPHVAVGAPVDVIRSADALDLFPERVPGVTPRWAEAVCLLPGADEADVDGIVDVVAAIENLRPLRLGGEQVGERRHRAVVQIRRAQPDAVEERRDVPGWIRFHQTLALDAEGLHR